jgi:hypothetical protein
MMMPTSPTLSAGNSTYMTDIPSGARSPTFDGLYYGSQSSLPNSARSNSGVYYNYEGGNGNGNGNGNN